MHRPNDQPAEQPQPVGRRQRQHQHQAAGDAQDRHHRHERAAERPCRAGVRPAHDEHRPADDDEGEQRADVGQVAAGRRSAAGRSGWRRRRRWRWCSSRACGSAGGRRRRTPWGTRPSRAIARKTRGALSIITSSTDVMPATPATAMMNSAQPRPTFSKASETPASYVDLLVAHHAGQHGDDRDVKDGADDQRGDDADGHVALGLLRLLGVGGDRVEADVGEEDDGRPRQHADRACRRLVPPCPATVMPKKLTPVQPYGAKSRVQLSGLM